MKERRMALLNRKYPTRGEVMHLFVYSSAHQDWSLASLLQTRMLAFNKTTFWVIHRNNFIASKCHTSNIQCSISAQFSLSNKQNSAQVFVWESDTFFFDTPHYVCDTRPLERLQSHKQWQTVPVLLNSTDLIVWDPAFASADWLVSKTWRDHVVQLTTL